MPNDTNRDIAALIPITERDGQQVASGRDIHAYLEVTTPYMKWFARMVEYGFTKDEDYTDIFVPVPSGRSDRAYTQTDHAVTFDMAKELGMIQRTAKGKQIRQYFIEMEKRGQREMEPQELMARAVLEANRQIKALEARVSEQQPKADAWDHIVSSAGSWSYEEAAKVLFEQGVVTIGQKRLVKQLVDWKYLWRDAKGRPHAYQTYVEQGLFVTKARVYTDQDTGETRQSSAPQVRITGKGLDMLFRRFREGQMEVAA